MTLPGGPGRGWRGGITICQSWLLPPCQSHCWIWTPLSADQPVTSSTLPLCTERMPNRSFPASSIAEPLVRPAVHVPLLDRRPILRRPVPHAQNLQTVPRLPDPDIREPVGHPDPPWSPRIPTHSLRANDTIVANIRQLGRGATAPIWGIERCRGWCSVRVCGAL